MKKKINSVYIKEIDGEKVFECLFTDGSKWEKFPDGKWVKKKPSNKELEDDFNTSPEANS